MSVVECVYSELSYLELQWPVITGTEPTTTVLCEQFQVNYKSSKYSPYVTAQGYKLEYNVGVALL